MVRDGYPYYIISDFKHHDQAHIQGVGVPLNKQEDADAHPPGKYMWMWSSDSQPINPSNSNLQRQRKNQDSTSQSGGETRKEYTQGLQSRHNTATRFAFPSAEGKMKL
ncbi:hypothetical protein BOTNAR_0170g00020 [Botryotinia narcissicola]|uniref:Uncharacterized protein n=1 Tax=Botryotinia narcissicola TaxID=278944 RepID=A0A4Z1IC80_9HELO|nr:hypothetical protein BOTNAR_0170g00020 [Botryotinia narcissicola]